MSKEDLQMAAGVENEVVSDQLCMNSDIYEENIQLHNRIVDLEHECDLLAKNLTCVNDENKQLKTELDYANKVIHQFMIGE